MLDRESGTPNADDCLSPTILDRRKLEPQFWQPRAWETFGLAPWEFQASAATPKPLGDPYILNYLARQCDYGLLLANTPVPHATATLRKPAH